MTSTPEHVDMSAIVPLVDTLTEDRNNSQISIPSGGNSDTDFQRVSMEDVMSADEESIKVKYPKDQDPSESVALAPAPDAIASVTDIGQARTTSEGQNDILASYVTVSDADLNTAEASEFVNSRDLSEESMEHDLEVVTNTHGSGLDLEATEGIGTIGAIVERDVHPLHRYDQDDEDIDMEENSETLLGNVDTPAYNQPDDRQLSPGATEMEVISEGDEANSQRSIVDAAQSTGLSGNDVAPKVENQDAAGSRVEDINMTTEDERSNDDLPSSATTASDNDLLNQIPNMYRLLQLILERGSGGLVHKIIIAQESLSQLINALQPGAYQSLTKVDFKALDQVEIRPIGVYGSKSEIVRFLKSVDAITEEVQSLLLLPRDERAELSRPYLESGLYFLTGNISGGKVHDAFVIYWPEETTWDDDVVSSVAKNRVTFMRYLSKLADQTLCLVSQEHAESLVFHLHSEQSDNGFTDVDMEDDDRVFSFEVAKTKEENENVTQYPGFEFRHSALRNPQSSHAMISSPILSPILIPGETACGFLTATHEPEKVINQPFHETYSEMRLKSLFENKNHRIDLPENIDEEVFGILFRHGFGYRYPQLCRTFEETTRSAIGRKKEESVARRKSAIEDGSDLNAATTTELTCYLYAKASEMYPTLQTTLDEALATQTISMDSGSTTHTKDPCSPDMMAMQQKTVRVLKLEKIMSLSYKELKYRALLCCALFEAHSDISEEDQVAITTHVFGKGDLSLDNIEGLSEQLVRPGLVAGFWSLVKKFTSVESDPLKEAKRKADESDPVFFSQLFEIQERWPCLCEGLHSMVNEAAKWIQSTVDSAVKDACKKLRDDREKALNKQFAQELRTAEQECKRLASKDLLKDIRLAEEESTSNLTRHHIIVECRKSTATWGASLMLKGRLQTVTEPAVKYTICPLSLTQSDEQALQMDLYHVPKPKYQTQQSQSFRLPLDHTLRFIQRIGKNKYLVIVDTDHECRIFVENIEQLDAAIYRNNQKRTLRYGPERMARSFSLTFDELKRTLAFCWTDKTHGSSLWLQLYVFDETYTTVSAKGTKLSLSPWYDGVPRIKSILFITGTEELCFIDDSEQGRVFSLVTEQFRPATVQLANPGQVYMSSPDGSCLLAVRQEKHAWIVRAIHWASFGSNSHGMEFSLSLPPDAIIGVTSFGTRPCIHLLGLSSSESLICSTLLVIQKKSSEFTFMEHEQSKGTEGTLSHTAHNVLLDCHMDVWTRFPVQAAFTRETLSPFGRSQTSLTFVSSSFGTSYSTYFKSMAKAFERLTRKPTGGRLEDMLICTVTMEKLTLSELELSSFHAGEWIVELLCLIPLHLAVTQQNRFIPLKDGVWSSDLERSLLGAELEDIVDALSLGWYESVFQSYLVTKPVRVVSSMGEQSVGKSYCLNHFADTSFAGSAMRTTEGVWMSVTPAQGEVIVALDFEGVHSIERSAQEDALLVLFNAAISNLILFRNNFALSRDITGLFTSFHSSSSVFDPDENPGLFNGQLCIIIKDVVDNDKREIVKEFSLKFQKIVQEEQESNFISKLHRGHLKIVPWPVINSPGFYSIFALLKKELDKQDVTHRSV